MAFSWAKLLHTTSFAHETPFVWLTSCPWASEDECIFVAWQSLFAPFLSLKSPFNCVLWSETGKSERSGGHNIVVLNCFKFAINNVTRQKGWICVTFVFKTWKAQNFYRLDTNFKTGIWRWPSGKKWTFVLRKKNACYQKQCSLIHFCFSLAVCHPFPLVGQKKLLELFSYYKVLNCRHSDEGVNF